MIPKRISHKHKRPFIADDLVLIEHNCLKQSTTTAEQNGNDTFIDSLKHFSGWSFIAHHNTILTSTELNMLATNIKDVLTNSFDSLRQEITTDTTDDLKINSHKLHLPPMLFGNDIFRLQFSNIALELNASDAILSWASQHVEEELLKNPITHLKVPYAKKWSNIVEKQFVKCNSIKDDVAEIADIPAIANNLLNSDWTFSSDYIVTVLDDIDNGKSIHFHQCKSSVIRKSELRNIDVYKDFLLQSVKSSSTTTPPTTITNPQSSSYSPFSTMKESHRNKNEEQNNKWTVVAEAQSGIDYDALKCTDQPILFFDEFILYQDDLEDCGEITFDAKIRVMPDCWFLLSKQYLRVDGSAIRAREIRLYHNFQNDIHYQKQQPPAPDHQCPPNQNQEELYTTRPAVTAPESIRIHMEVCWRELVLDHNVLSPMNSSNNINDKINPNPNNSSIFGFSASATSVGENGLLPNNSLNGLWGKDGKTLTHLLPIVNKEEGISQHYSLIYHFPAV